MSQIPTIPPPAPGASLGDVVAAVNDRIRRINVALAAGGGLGGAGGPGITVGALAARPAGLDNGSKGAVYLTSDTYQAFWWSGGAWVEVTPANNAQIAYSSGTLTLTNAYQDVPGCSITLARAGRHKITGFFDVNGVNDAQCYAVGQLVANAAGQTYLAVLYPLGITGTGVTGNPLGVRATVSQQWLYTASAAGQVVKLQAYKTGAAGGSSFLAGQCSICAEWVGP